MLTSPTGECVCLPQDGHGVFPALFNSRNVTSSTTMSSTCTPIMSLPSSEAAHSKHSSEMLDKTMTSNYHPQGARASGFVVGATSSHRVFFCFLTIIMLFTFSRDVLFFWDSPLVYHPQGAGASGFVVGTTSSHRDLQCFPFTFSCDFLFSWDSPAVSDARVFGIVVCHCTAMDHSMMGKESRFFSFCLSGSLHMPAAWVFGFWCSHFTAVTVHLSSHCYPFSLFCSCLLCSCYLVDLAPVARMFGFWDAHFIAARLFFIGHLFSCSCLFFFRLCYLPPFHFCFFCSSTPAARVIENCWASHFTAVFLFFVHVLCSFPLQGV